MTQAQLHAPLEAADIEQLDLAPVRRKLQDADEGLGWSAEHALTVEREYKRFLALKRRYPNREIVPNKAVDQFWHQHILDTARYAADCERLFGTFLHHDPHFGVGDQLDQLNQAFAHTCGLYEQHFGETYDAAASRCRTQCKPVRCK